MPTQKYPDGCYKLHALLNDGHQNGLAVLDVVIRDGTPHALVSLLPTTAGEEKVWRVLDANQLERIQAADAHFFYRQMLFVRSDLESVWRELYGHVRPFVHTEGSGMRFVAAGNRVFYSDPKGKPWKYVADFLKFFAEQIFGRDWILAEIQKPPAKQHQIVKFHWALFDQLQKSPKNELGEYGISPCGSSK